MTNNYEKWIIIGLKYGAILPIYVILIAGVYLNLIQIITNSARIIMAILFLASIIFISITTIRIIVAGTYAIKNI